MRFFVAVIVGLILSESALGKTPAIVQASLRLHGGGCSGTVIHKHRDRAYLVTCDHCTGGAGSTFSVQSPHTGRGYEARVLATDRNADLTLAVVQPDAALAVVEPAEHVPDNAEWIAAGYPCTSAGCTGPKLKRLSLRGTDSTAGRARNVYRLHGGTFAGGDSGGGVAIRYAGRERYVGTLSHSGPRGTTYRQTRAFLIRNADKFGRGCDAWWCQPNVELDPPDNPLPADAASQLNERMDRLEELIRQRQERDPLDREKLMQDVSETVQTILDRREHQREKQELRQEVERLRQERQRLSQTGPRGVAPRQDSEAVVQRPQHDSRERAAADALNTATMRRSRLPAVGRGTDALLQVKSYVAAYMERRERQDEILDELRQQLSRESGDRR